MDKNKGKLRLARKESIKMDTDKDHWSFRQSFSYFDMILIFVDIRSTSNSKRKVIKDHTHGIY